MLVIARGIALLERNLSLLIYITDRSPTLIAIAAQHNHHGAQNDLQVKQQRPVFDVEQVQFHHLLKRQAVSARYLPQSRHSGLHVQSLAMPQLVSFYLVWNRRAWPHDAHVTAQHIQKLRHFIQTKATQHSPDARDAWIVT